MNSHEILQVLNHHGFISSQEQAKQAIHNVAADLNAAGNYASVDALLLDLTNGGQFTTPAGISIETAKVFFEAAGYHNASIEATNNPDGTISWGEA